ncbi:Replication protein [Habropoda laboriosa]|uniref:Replication protein n=1 Tax=Habropoda laboriosa TaxID=597456 RepID=A0A0L7QJ70_9HYME|nr:Replication protein [Habropoda laboriosa]
MKVLKSADREKLLFQQRQGLLEQIKLKEKNQQKLLENEVEILALEKNKQEREDFFRLDRALESYMKIQKAVLNDRIRLENERRRDVLKKTGKSTSEAQKKRNEENRRKYELGGAINNMQDIIVKDNALINASYNLDLVEQRLILLAIVEARESGKGITANDPLEVHAESYINQFNVARQTAYQALKDACKDLFARQFSYQEINKRGKVEHVLSRWVSEIRYIDDEATVKLIFSPSIVPLITRLEEQFTKYELQQISKLTSAYAVRGILSKNSDNKIDLSEAIRVFGEPIKKGNVKEDVKIDKIESAEVLLLRQQVDMLKNQLDDAKGRESFYQNQIETMQRLLEAPKDKEELLLQPDKGALIKNGGGIRKIRCSQSNKGKSGGIRVIYYWVTEDD